RGGRTGSRTLGRSSLYGWLKERDSKGIQALAVKAAPKAPPQPWEAAFLRIWSRPSNMALTEVLALLAKELPEDVPCPTYDQARHFLRSLSPQERYRGRMGRRALVAISAYRKRDTSDLEPTSVYTADGKTFAAEVRNPLSGQPFRPEIASVLDVATRKCVGWSVGLAESASVVTESLRMAVVSHGVPAIWY
uniref:hypothetical protein n=1 Tax=Telmatospirillum sp. J64-1 TaxID=2502183 RepID=UPI001C8F5AC0